MPSNRTLRGGRCALPFSFAFVPGFPHKLVPQQAVEALVSRSFHAQAESGHAQTQPELVQFLLAAQMQDKDAD